MNDRAFQSLNNSDKLYHYGTPHQGATPHSGRYPWGTGEFSYQRASDLRAFATEKRKEINPETGKKYTDTEIARAWGVSTTEYRKMLSIDKNKERAANIATAIKYRDNGLSISVIAEKMGQPESNVRSWLEPSALERATATRNVADYLKEQVGDKKYLDIGKGVSAQLGISETKLKNAVEMLKDEGYKVQTIKVEQATNPRQKTTIQVITKDDVPWAEVNSNREKIRSPMGVWFEDNGKTMRNIREPVSIDSSRISICYAEDGGKNKDGVIEIRPGVADLSLGQDHYAQVRIAVDGTHYLKGMAIYSDSIPEGYDIRFNTNKTSDVPKMDVLKKMKTDKVTGEIDEDNPFGATIRQFDYVGEDGQKHQSSINIVNSEEDWDRWSKTLSSQYLSKQFPSLAKQQLDLVYREKKDQYDEISKLSNPTIKKKLLEDLAEDCDSCAVHLKAAALPRQETKVILPLESIKDNEVYAPTYKNGEEVVLVRFPHGGTFESPRLIVNNNNKEGKAVLGDAKKAIGINSNVAEILSGADFDGDTVTVIPTINQKIKTSSRLKALENFDPKEQYKAYEGMPKVGEEDGFNTQRAMGQVSNLITDMTIKGASESEIARAVKHSMVVIDAEKHNLNWRQSEDDQQIKQLKERYQKEEGRSGYGASTIISRAKGRKDVPLRADRYDIDSSTGEKKFYISKDATWTDKEGKVHTRTERSTKMAEAKDAYELVSRDDAGSTTTIETIYADHANRLKSLANEIRKEYVSTPNGGLNREAAGQYKDEVDSLEAKLRIAELNAPNERLAQAAASKYVESVKKVRDLSDEDEKKLRSQTIEATRAKAGAVSRDKRSIQTTDEEWEAIVAGALSSEKTKKILTYMEPEEVLSRTIPRDSNGLSPVKEARARAMLNSGYSWADVAEAVGVSETILRKNI